MVRYSRHRFPRLSEFLKTGIQTNEHFSSSGPMSLLSPLFSFFSLLCFLSLILCLSIVPSLPVLFILRFWSIHLYLLNSPLLVSFPRILTSPVFLFSSDCPSPVSCLSFPYSLLLTIPPLSVSSQFFCIRLPVPFFMPIRGLFHSFSLISLTYYFLQYSIFMLAEMNNYSHFNEKTLLIILENTALSISMVKLLGSWKPEEN